MKEIGIATAIRRCLEINAGLKPKEKVLLVTDVEFDQNVVDAFGIIAAEMGAEVCKIIMEPVSKPGEVPNRMVCEAMKASDVVCDLGTQWIGSSRARTDACAAGARYLAMTEMNAHMLRKGGPFYSDFVALKPWVESVEAKFAKAKTLRLSTKIGTNVTAKIDGRKGRGLTSLATTPGAYQGPPVIEIGVAPIEDAVEGVLVVDGLQEFLKLGVIKKPFKIHIKKGRAVEIEAEEDNIYANTLKELFETSNDPNIYTVAEISMGGNPNSRLCDFALECESAIGSVHVAFGDNLGYGGVNKAIGHFDQILRPNCTLYLDDELILQDGRLMIGGLPK